MLFHSQNRGTGIVFIYFLLCSKFMYLFCTHLAKWYSLVQQCVAAVADPIYVSNVSETCVTNKKDQV